MKILSIETSCDETAVSLVEATEGLERPVFHILGNSLFSQVEFHKEFGGVYPNVAKREHAKNLPPLFRKTLSEASMLVESRTHYSSEQWQTIEELLSKEHGLFEHFKTLIENIEKPNIDVITVTTGPGLEPALWVGISFAKALGYIWNIPVIPVNHMEGHIASILSQNSTVTFPSLALLISGGHTELVQIDGWGSYKIIGETRDDAVGEAFDKVARMMNLPYPGGPEISKLAAEGRAKNLPKQVKLPRPMIHSGDYNFSFSGLKTAVLYHIRDHSPLNEMGKMDLAREFEDAVVEVLLDKTKKAIVETNARTLIVAGGVISNTQLRESFMALANDNLVVYIPTKDLATDNSVMIAFAGYLNTLIDPQLLSKKHLIRAQGNLRLHA